MRNGVAGVACGLMVLAFSLACGGAGGGYDNVAACTRYVDAMNGLTCIDLNYEADQMCPTMLNSTPYDMARYYDCMAAAARCNGDIPDLAGQQDCGSPTGM